MRTTRLILSKLAITKIQATMIVAIIAVIGIVAAYYVTLLAPSPSPTTTPTPKPTLIPLPSPTVSPTPTPSPSPTPTPSPIPTTMPTPTPTPRPSPTPSPSPSPSPTPAPTPTATPIQVGNVTVHFINVGQGDYIFIDTQEKDVLIDGGPKSAGTAVVQYLFRLNITHIDVIIATHPHEDHIGGLITVMQQFDSYGYSIQTVYDSGFNWSTTTYQEYIALAKKYNFTLAERGQRIQLDSISWMTILHPAQPPPFNDPNNNSIVVKLQVNTVSFLFTGDAEKEAEQSILNAQVDIKSTILKIGHHGSETSTTIDFLRVVNPKVAVISVGKNNWGHPNPETLNRLATQGVDVYRTDIDGTVIITTNGTNYAIGFIK